MKRTRIRCVPAIVAIGVLVALGACTTVGAGSGDLSDGPAKTSGSVLFSWKVVGAATRGDMVATLPEGRDFSGPFVQMTRERFPESDPLWDGWPYGELDWSLYGAHAGTTFETDYGGQVVADLKGPGNDRMRCRFALNQPSSGMAAGGKGQCRLTGGATIDAVFPRT